MTAANGDDDDLVRQCAHGSRAPFRLFRKHRSFSPEKLFDRLACAHIFYGKTNGDSDPVIEGRERLRNLDTFTN